MNNNQATIQKLETMKLRGMARAFRAGLEGGLAKEVSPEELLSHLVEAEWDERYNRKLARLIKQARFRIPAVFEHIDYGLKRGLDRQTMLRLSDCRWVESHRDIIISGPCGVGKSFLACALGHQACVHGNRVGYFSASRLFSNLKLCRADGSYAREMARIQKHAVVIVDDFGLEKLDAPSRMSMLEILEDRHRDSSTIIVSQFPVAQWHPLIGEPTIADAICDRIVHSAHRIELKGESVRKLQASKAQQEEGGKS